MGKKSLFIALMCLVVVSSALAQPAFTPDMTFPVFRHPAPGYYMMAPNSSQTIALVDHGGKNVFPVSAAFPANVQCLDSTLTYFDGAAKKFVRLNSSFVAIDTMSLSGNYDVDFHECRVLPNGNYVILGTEERIMNLSAIVPGGKSQARVVGAVFQERTFSGNTVFEWRSLDHIPVTDATNDIDLTQETIDYIHVNSIVRDTDGNFIVSCRHTDEVIKVNRNSGVVMWRMGGEMSKGNQFTFIDDNVDEFFGFSHQHDVSRTSNGRIIMYDNGNLKPTTYSRVAEYEVNEAAKTAKLVWSYRPFPDVYSKSMGSVQELTNGNILVGFGSTPDNLVAREISRDGTVQIEIQSTAKVTPYRVRKAVFAMSGTEHVISSPGTYSFTHGDSTTHFSTTISLVDAPTSVIAERHSYAPHGMTFTAAEPCVPFPMRWVVRASNPGNLKGTMRFNIGTLGFVVPGSVELYQRPIEGNGAFTRVVASYDVTNTSFILNGFKPGEYLMAYPMCYDPTPSLPLNGAANVSNNTILRWTAAVQTGGYDVEVYAGSGAVGTPLRSFHTARLDTLISLPEPGAPYSWRVRTIRPAPSGAGPWSATFMFRTRLGAPVALSPSSLPDSVAIPQRSTFRWTRVKYAVRYRVQIIPYGTSTPALDTVVSDTSMRVAGNLPWHKTMMWSVRGEVDGSTGDWSNTMFIVTPPCPPRLLTPVPEDQTINPEAVTFTWSSVEGAKLYHIRVYKDVDSGTPWYDDSVSSTLLDIFNMTSVTAYHWQVRTIGRYGPGPWSATQWFLTRGQSVLGVASLLTPVDAVNIDTLQVTLAWTSVLEATYYHVQLTTKTSFAKPDLEWKSVGSTTVQCPPLDAAKVYRWRVMALNDVASGSWSDTAMFTTMPGPDDALEPLTPIAGCIDVPVRGNVTFITDNRFNEYRVEYALTPSFADVEQATNVTAGVAAYNLKHAQQYWWRVVGLVNSAPVDTGSTASFTTAVSAITGVERTDESPVVFRLVSSTLTLQGPIEGSLVQVMDIAGRNVHESVVLSTGHTNADLSHLPTGVYVALLRLADSRVVAYSFVLSAAH